VEGENGS